MQVHHIVHQISRFMSIIFIVIVTLYLCKGAREPLNSCYHAFYNSVYCVQQNQCTHRFDDFVSVVVVVKVALILRRCSGTNRELWVLAISVQPDEACVRFPINILFKNGLKVVCFDRAMWVSFLLCFRRFSVHTETLIDSNVAARGNSVMCTDV